MSLRRRTTQDRVQNASVSRLRRIFAGVRRACFLLLAAVGVASCGRNPAETGNASSASSASAAVPIARTYVPRLERENYWEPIAKREAGPQFLLLIHPRLEVPQEGPFTLVVRRANGPELARIPGRKVDVATGGITLLCDASFYDVGDYLVELELEEGGRTSGATKHTFRFRVE